VRKSRFILLLVSVLSVPFLAFTPLAPTSRVPAASGNPENSDLLKEARRFLEEKSYKKAYDRFAKALDLDRYAGQKDAIRLDMGTCLRGLKKWQEAVGHFESLIHDRAESLTEARARYRLADVYFRKPHHTYRKDGKDLGPTHVPGAQYRNTEEEDLSSARKNLDRARALYGRLLENPGNLKPGEIKGIPHERIDLNYLFAQVLERLQIRIGGWWWGRDRGEYQKRVDRVRPLHDKVLKLLEENYLSSVLSSSPRDAARALYHKAMYLRRYSEKWWARDPETRKPLPLKETPNALLSRLLKEFPEDGFADDAHYTLGLLASRAKDYPAGIAHFKRLLEKFPRSRWVEDARHKILQIRRPVLELNIGGLRLPGSSPVIQAVVRNIPELAFTAYRVPLERYLGSAEGLKSLQTAGFQNLARTLTEIVGREKFRQNREAGWPVKTPDEGKHLRRSFKVEVPVSGSGAYLIEARGKDTVQTGVLVVSDLVIVRKRARAHSLFFLADARTGVPVDGANIIARQKARKRSGLVDQGRTDADGLWTCPHRFPFGVRYTYIDAFAWLDGRYALTGWSYQSKASSRTQGKVYGFTDRGVYRPGQTVFYSALVRAARNDGLYENLQDREVALEIRGPRGKKLLVSRSRTDAYGMVQGSWKVPVGAGLGRYRLYLRTLRGFRLRANIYFRVEEYKRPEFEVTVEQEGTARAGEAFKTRVSARYYFGGPVAGARVKYSVFRQRYHHRFRFSDPFSYLYDRPARMGRGGGRIRRTSSEELVLKGEGTTGAKGTFRLAVETEPWVKKYPDQDHCFRIRAEVMDRSRRTIEGTGRIKITVTEYFAAIEIRRAFAAPGENVTVEVRTEKPDGGATAAQGVIKVFQSEPLPPPPVKRSDKEAGDADEGKKAKERLVQSFPVSTDVNGRALIHWKTGEEGYYVLRYEGRDEAEGLVKAVSPVWVCGKNWTGRKYRYQNLEILTDRNTYRVGDVARVLVNAQVDNPTLVLSQEADRDILKHRVHRITGRSVVLEVPIHRALEPNFFLEGFLVHGGKVFRAYQEVFVPPVEQFLNVDVAYSSKDYRPGQKGEARVRLTDVDGKAVKGRVALGTVDASLDAIQGDPAPDIRRFFYGKRRGRRVGYQDSNSFQSRSMAWKEVKLPPHRWAGNPPGWSSFPQPTDLWAGDLQREASRLDREFLEEKKLAMASKKSKRGILSEAEGGESTDAAGPPPPAASADAGPVSRRARGGRIGQKGGRGAAAVAPVKIREDFAETAHFDPAVQVGEDGTAKVHFTFPDSLTRWRTTARAYTPDTRVGQRRAYVVTTKKLMVRPQAPRFFRERDEVVLSAIVNAYFEEAVPVTVTLDLGGGTCTLLDPADRKVTVAPGGEVRVDWRLKVTGSGTAEVLVKALSARESDAVKRTFPVLRYGAPRTVTRTATLVADGKVDLAFEVPAARAPGSASLEVTLNPSLAGVLVDALPYLLEYPHGCVEQTLSRFLPAVVTRATLRHMGINLEDIQRKRKDLVHAGDQAGKRDPVFDSDTLHDMITRGLRRIRGFQRPDGGFGWFPGGVSDPYMTAYVAYGLNRAKEAEVEVDRRMLKRALNYLEAATQAERNLHRAAYQCFVLALNDRPAPAKVLEGVFEARDSLNHYGRALLALAAHHAGRSEWARITLDNLEDFLQHDPRTQASSLPTAGPRWCWWSDSVETHAFALMAFNRIRPSSPHREGLMRWLVASRRGNRWRSTKDTAHAIYALAGFMRSTGELDPDLTVEVFLDGEPVRKIRITRDNLLSFQNRITLPDASLSSGPHTLTVSRSGRGRIHALARFTYFSLEDVIQASGHDMAVTRTYYRVTPVEKQVGGRIRLGWKREVLKPGAVIQAGDTLEVALKVEAFHDYDYLMIEDPKPAGFEAVAMKSGGTRQGGLWTYMELRDQRVAFFLPGMRKGEVTLPYRVRAEVPGILNAMPAAGALMYAPEVGGTSDSWRTVVKDRD